MANNEEYMFLEHEDTATPDRRDLYFTSRADDLRRAFNYEITADGPDPYHPRYK